MKLKKIAATLTAAVMAFTAVATPLCDNIPPLERGLSASAYYSVKDSFYPVTLTGDGANDMINVAVAQAGRKDDDDGWYPSGEAWCADFVLDVPGSGLVAADFAHVMEQGHQRNGFIGIGHAVYILHPFPFQIGSQAVIDIDAVLRQPSGIAAVIAGAGRSRKEVRGLPL